MADTIQQLEDLKEWSQNPERYERRMNFRGGQLVQPGPGYKPGGLVEPGVTHYARKSPTKINEDLFKQIDNLIADAERSGQMLGKKGLGEALGYKKVEKGKAAGQQGITKIIEAWEKSRDRIFEFKPATLEGTEIAQKIINASRDAKYIKEDGTPNIKRIAKEFFPDRKLDDARKHVRGILKTGIDYKGTANIEGEIRALTKGKKKALEDIKIATKKAGGETTKRANQVINTILEQNEIYQKMSVEDIAKDKDFLKRLRLGIDPVTGEINYTGYTKKRPIGGKVFTDLELAQHAKDRAMKYTLFSPDHITPKTLRRQNVGYPINFQATTYMENSHLDNARKYLLKNPDGANVIGINNYLNERNLTIRGKDFITKNNPLGRHGYQEAIEYIPERGTNTIVESSFKKTVPKFKPKIAGDTALHSFPANIPAMWKRLGHGTKRILGWGTALLFEKVFFDWDRANEISKGKTGEEATGIALNNATFGIVPNKKYLPELKKVAEDMGIDSRAFEKVYFLNENMAKVQKEHQRYQEMIESLEATEGNPEKKARAVAHMKKRYAEWQAAMKPEIEKWSEDVAGQVAISKTKLPKPSLDQIAEARYDITDVDWLKPFAEIQMVGEEKLKREKTRAYDVQSKLADPESGEKYKWITNLFTGTEDFFGLPSGVKEQRLIDDMIEKGGPGELYRYNRARGLDPDSPVTKEALENLQYEHPGLGLGFAEGGLASLLKKK